VVLGGLLAAQCRSSFFLHLRKFRGVYVVLFVDNAAFFGCMRRCLFGSIEYFCLGAIVFGVCAFELCFFRSVFLVYISIPFFVCFVLLDQNQ